MAFVCKQTAVLVVSINNIGQYQCCFNRLVAIFSLDNLPDTSVDLTSCISITFSVLNISYSFDHYAACWVTLRKVHDHVVVFTSRALTIAKDVCM